MLYEWRKLNNACNNQTNPTPLALLVIFDPTFQTKCMWHEFFIRISGYNTIIILIIWNHWWGNASTWTSKKVVNSLLETVPFVSISIRHLFELGTRIHEINMNRRRSILTFPMYFCFPLGRFVECDISNNFWLEIILKIYFVFLKNILLNWMSYKILLLFQILRMTFVVVRS